MLFCASELIGAVQRQPLHSTCCQSTAQMRGELVELSVSCSTVRTSGSPPRIRSTRIRRYGNAEAPEGEVDPRSGGTLPPLLALTGNGKTGLPGGSVPRLLVLNGNIPRRSLSSCLASLVQEHSAVKFFNDFAETRKTRNTLPHWQQEGATYFVTWRLADSIPQELLDKLRLERVGWIVKKPGTLG